MYEPRSRDYLRHQRERIIRKRMKIIRDVWKSHDNLLLGKAGKLAKYNLACSCWMCKECRKSKPASGALMVDFTTCT